MKLLLLDKKFVYSNEVLSTKYQVPSIKYQVQSIEYKVLSLFWYAFGKARITF